MKYIAHLTQDGGCDYSIGCGQKVIAFDAEDMDDAGTKLILLIAEEYIDDTELSAVNLYEVSDYGTLDMKGVYAEIGKVQAALLSSVKEESEAKEYARLKVKFENA